MSSKRTRRFRKRDNRWIQAAGNAAQLNTEAVVVDWIRAGSSDGSDGDPDDDKLMAKPAKFSMVAYTGGPMQVGYYGSPVVIDLAGIAAKAPIPILANHDMTQIVGHADTVDVAESSLKLSGLISGAGDAAEQVQASAAKGFPWKASVGARPDKLEFVGEGIKTTVNGKTFTGPLYVARKSTLGEVSFVAVAADGRTSAKVAASAAYTREGIDMKFEQWIEAMGLVLADLRDDQVAKLRAKYDAEVQAAGVVNASGNGHVPKVEAPKFDLSGVCLTYEKHMAGVQAKSAEYTGKVAADKLAEIQAGASKAAAEMKAKALNEEWAPTRLEVELVKAQASFEVALIQAERPKGPAIHASMRDGGAQVIEAAFAQSCGLQNADKVYKPEVLEAAWKHRGIGIQELLLNHAVQAGYSGRMRIGDDNLREVIRAAFSTHTLTTLLTSTGNKLLLEGFMSIPQSWREVAAVRSVSDFKTVTAFRLNASLEYEEVGPAGEIKHGTLSQESYTMQAKTYAKMLALTRTDIINDDLGAFNDLRARLGLGAAIKMNKVFWTAWLTAYSGAAFWTAARGNLVTSSALAEAGLTSAVKAFRNMAGPDGNMMSLEPDRVLVPADLEATARKLYSSQEYRDTTANTKFVTANIYQNRFMPVVVPELGNSSYTGYSATTWYLLANPAILASAVMCFLNGVQNPTIESTDADFDTLGIQFRGYHDFGVSMSEYRASVAAEA
jgi:phage major head subunit gpT-like protein